MSAALEVSLSTVQRELEGLTSIDVTRDCAHGAVMLLGTQSLAPRLSGPMRITWTSVTTLMPAHDGPIRLWTRSKVAATLRSHDASSTLPQMVLSVAVRA